MNCYIIVFLQANTHQGTIPLARTLYLCELLPRVELGTSSLPRMRSTTELKQQLVSNFERKTGLKPATPSLEG